MMLLMYPNENAALNLEMLQEYREIREHFDAKAQYIATGKSKQIERTEGDVVIHIPQCEIEKPPKSFWCALIDFITCYFKI
jgi:hypothetical protein